MGALRVLVVEPCWWWCEAILRVLEHADEDFVVIAERDVPRIQTLVDKGDIDVVIINSDDAQLAVLSLPDRPNCVVLGEDKPGHAVALALRTGSSYAEKSDLTPEALRRLVLAAAVGDALFIQPQPEILSNLISFENEGPAAKYGLTPRELQVIECLSRGLSNAEIGAELYLAPGSVKKLVSRCLTRLGVRNRTEAALLGRAEGLCREIGSAS